MEMNFSSQGVSTSVLETHEGITNQTVEYALHMWTPKSDCIKTTFEKLKKAEVWRKDTLGFPLLL